MVHVKQYAWNIFMEMRLFIKKKPSEILKLKEEREPRLEEAKSGQRVVYFVDAAHFVLAPFLGILWCFTRLFIKAPSGRK
jgi:hypothetical protein